MKVLNVQFFAEFLVLLAAFHCSCGGATAAAATAAVVVADDEDGNCNANDVIGGGGEGAAQEQAPLLAITACTGEAGSRVLTALRSVHPKNRIRCLVRSGTNKPLDHLNDLESVHQVDFTSWQSIADALQNTTAAYLNTPPSLDVLVMRQNMATACKANSDKLGHIVLMGEAVDISWYGLSQYWDDHKAGEDALQKTGIPITVLHPAFFMEGFATHFGNAQTIIESDYFSRVGTAPVAFTSLVDVAEVTTKILLEGPKVHGWKSYNLINDVLTGDQVATAMSKALGRTIEYKPITAEEFAAGMVAGGVPQIFVDGYTVATQHAGEGYFSNNDLGQLEALLGRKPTSLLEVLLTLKPLLSKESTLERPTNK